MLIKKSILICIVPLILLCSCAQNREEHDPDYGKQWALLNQGPNSEMEIDAAYCRTTNIEMGIDIDFDEMCDALEDLNEKREVVVAIVDTGIDFSSKDLEGLQWINPSEVENNGIDDDNNGKIDDYSGWNFITNSNVIQEKDQAQENDHGTVSAGIIAAKKNGYGIEGITRGQNIKLMPLKVLGTNYNEGDGRISNVIEAIIYAEKMGASICNLSLGTNEDVPGLYEVIKNSKMLFVTSAGNNPGLLRMNIDKKNQFPASYDLPNLITVANLSFDGYLYPESNYGPTCVDLAAPGTNVFSTTIEGQYIYSTGTSFAVPCVTGVATVLYQYMDHPSANLAKKAICDSVTSLPSLNGLVRTGGMLNAHDAILLGIQN